MMFDFFRNFEMADLVNFLVNQTLDKSAEYDTTFKEIKT